MTLTLTVLLSTLIMVSFSPVKLNLRQRGEKGSDHSPLVRSPADLDTLAGEAETMGTEETKDVDDSVGLGKGLL